MKMIISKLLSNPELSISIIICIFEILVRLRPTAKNLSLLDNLHKLVSFVLPNYTNQTKREKLEEVKSKIEQRLKEKFNDTIDKVKAKRSIR